MSTVDIISRYPLVWHDTATVPTPRGHEEQVYRTAKSVPKGKANEPLKDAAAVVEEFLAEIGAEAAAFVKTPRCVLAYADTAKSQIYEFIVFIEHGKIGAFAEKIKNSNATKITKQEWKVKRDIVVIYGLEQAEAAAGPEGNAAVDATSPTTSGISSLAKNSLPASTTASTRVAPNSSTTDNATRATDTEHGERSLAPKRRACVQVVKEASERDVNPETRASILSILADLGRMPDDEDDDVTIYCGPVGAGPKPAFKKRVYHPISYWVALRDDISYVDKFRRDRAEFERSLKDAAIRDRLAVIDAQLQKEKDMYEELTLRSKLKKQMAVIKRKRGDGQQAAVTPLTPNVTDTSVIEVISPPSKKTRLA